MLCLVRLPPPDAPWPDRDLAGLPESERVAAARLGPARARHFLGGRVALHAAARAAGVSLGPVGRADNGAPELPPDLSASISHKGDRAVALVAREPGTRLGVDVEALRPERPAIARLVLAPPPKDSLGALRDAARWRAILVRFSLKEALYKALPPAWQSGFRMSGAWLEAEGDPAGWPRPADGLPLRLGMEGLDSPLGGRLWWLEDAVLTAVSLRPALLPPAPPASAAVR